MDRFSDTNFDQKTIYEIYRACRLCGAGAGYIMPIIQNVVDLDGRDVELKQKIRECVQIEADNALATLRMLNVSMGDGVAYHQVSQDDKMPPLICELCVDKVNDFYEFFDMCRQTNKRTRQRLGLPVQTLASGASETSDCILGITEPVYCKDDSDEPLSKSKSKVKGKVKKEEVKIKVEPEILEERRSRRSSPATKRRTRNSQPSPPPTRRRTEMKQQEKKTMVPLKSILKKEKVVENDLPRLKRSREKDTQPELPMKRVKIAAKPITKSPSRPTRKPSPKPTPKPNISRTTRQSMHACTVCGAGFKTIQSLSNHQRIHPKKLPVSSKNNTSKNISGKTNNSKPQKNNHHYQPKETKSPPSIQHDYTCNKCERVFNSQRSLLRHQSSCTTNQKASQAVIDPAVLGSLRKVEIRVARCDSLLSSRDTCWVTDLEKDFGLDGSCVYPYISSVRSLRIKNEPVIRDGMVSIGEEIKRQFEEGAFVNWDSDNSSDTDEELGSESKRRPEPLSRLALKTIYSDRFLGKVPRKRRHIKLESRNSVEMFDDDHLTVGEDISEKVASFDDLLRYDANNERKRENNIDEVSKETEDCVMDHHKDSTKTNDSDSDKDGSYVSTKASDSLEPDLSKDCIEKEANIENNESVDYNISSEENNILNVRGNIVNNEDEVISKSSLSVNEDIKKTDEKQELIAEEIVAEDKMSQENNINRDENNDNKDEVSGTIVNTDENCEKLAQNAEKSEKITSNEKETEIERDGNISTDDKENGITDKDRESKGDSIISNHAKNDNDQQKESGNQEKVENDDQMAECDVKNGNTADKCVANGVADSKDEGSTKEEDISDMQLGIKNDSAEVKENTEENSLGLNGGEFTDEMDRKLMEELDAQIGECEGEGDSACDRDKITLADLLPDKAHERLDLDSIADEFNFDP